MKELKKVWIWEPLLGGRHFIKDDNIANHPCWFDLDEAQGYLNNKYGGDLTFSFPENFIANVKSANAKVIGRLHLLDFYQPEHKTINIPICDMVVTLTEPKDQSYSDLPAYGAGTITSKLKEACPLCNETDCYKDCPSSIAPSGETVEDCESRKTYNDRVDAIESLILACACAGVDIESLAFIEAIETAHQAIGSN